MLHIYGIIHLQQRTAGSMLHVGGASLSHYVRLLVLVESAVCSMRILIAGLAALMDLCLVSTLPPDPGGAAWSSSQIPGLHVRSKPLVNIWLILLARLHSVFGLSSCSLDFPADKRPIYPGAGSLTSHYPSFISDFGQPDSR